MFSNMMFSFYFFILVASMHAHKHAAIILFTPLYLSDNF